MKKEIRFYQTNSGKRPFIDWLEAQKDKVVRAQVNARLARLAVGNYGDTKSIGKGIQEARIHYGAGYRVYFAELDNEIILLLLGGSKNTQEKDIKKAKEYWQKFMEGIELCEKNTLKV